MLHLRKKRQSLALLAAAAVMLACLAPVRASAQGIPFEDVPQDAPYYDAVAFCYANDIVKGVTPTRFVPNGIFQRAEVVTLLGRVANYLKLKTDGYKSPFTDVPPGSFYERYVGWAASTKIVEGVTATTFLPSREMTRQEASMLIVQFADRLGFKLDSSDKTVFADRHLVSSWAEAAVKRAIAAGLVIGKEEGLLRPLDKITRAEAVTLIHTLCERYIGDTKLYYIFSEYIKTDPRLPLNNYIAANFKKNGSFRSYQDENVVSMQGVDVSSHQATINWAKARAAGVEFAMIRVGYRGYGVTTGGKIIADAYFKSNVQGALDNGIKVGVYFFSQAISVKEAQEEANFVLSQIKGYDISFPVVFDWENIANATARTDKVSAKTVTDCALAYCSIVERAGYIPMVYFNIYISMRLYEIGRLEGLDFWLAEYKDIPGYVYDFKIWQYTESGKVDGIPWNVDMNLSFVDYSKR
ncbi:MAG: S-layer homology domain-containing protein [Oscillospiraceae bacterium]|nr:S-layer homology domain-containing protein [Oscillospiraceae bacterium]